MTITLKLLIAVTLLGFALCLAVLALRKKPLAVLAGPALVWVLSLAAPVSWMVLSKAHAYVHVHLVPMLWHFALVPVSCALLVWLVKTAITAVKEYLESRRRACAPAAFVLQSKAAMRF